MTLDWTNSRGRATLVLAIAVAGLALWVILGSGGPSAEAPAGHPWPFRPSAAPHRDSPVLRGVAEAPGADAHGPAGGEDIGAAPIVKDSSDVVKGRVIDEVARNPIQGALVFISDELDPSVGPTSVLLSDSTGEFTLPASTLSAGRVLTVLARGFVPRTEPVAALKWPADIHLQTGGSIKGRVLDPRGEPVAGARVSASANSVRATWPANESLLPGGSHARGGWTISEADGSFTLAGLGSASAYYLRAERDGYTTDEDRAPPQASPGEEQSTIVLLPYRRLRISVIDAGTRTPVFPGECRVLTPGLRLAGPLDNGEPGMKSVLEPIWRRQYLELYLVPREAAVPQPGVPSRVRVMCQPAGYEPIDKEILLVDGSHTNVTIEAQRPAGSRWVQVTPLAQFSTGRPYTGELVLRVMPVDGGEGGSREMWCRFRGGQSEQVHVLPEGGWFVTPQGVGPSASLWSPAGPVSRWELRREDDHVRPVVVVQGNPVTLRVVDRSAARLRYFMMSVGPAEHPVAIPFWDMPPVLGKEGHGAPDSVWVAPGLRSFVARLEDAVSAPASVDASGDGSQLGVELMIPTPP